VPAVDVKNQIAAIETLTSPNLAAKYTAFQVLHKFLLQGPGGLPPGNLDPKKSVEENPWLRARLEWLMTKVAGPSLESRPWDVEVFGQTIEILKIRAYRDHYGDLSKGLRNNLHFAEFSKRFTSLVNRTTTTRRELLLALRDTDPKFAKEWIEQLAGFYDGEDRFYLAAINIAVGTDPKRREIILADFEKHFPEWNDKVAKLVWELRPPQVIAKLDQKLADPKLTAAQKAQVLDILSVAQGPEAGTTLLKLLAGNPEPGLRAQALASLKANLPGKWAALKKTPELQAAADKLFGDPATRIAGIELVAAGEIAEAATQVYELAADEKEPREVRVAAVRGLGDLKTGYCSRKLAELLKEAALEKEVIQALGKHPNSPAHEALVGVLKDEKRPADVRVEAMSALAGSRGGATWLLGAHSKKELPEQLLPDAGRLLRNSPYQDLRNKAMIAFPAPGKIDLKRLPEIGKLTSRKGNADHGKQLFTTNKDLGCVRCHSLRGAGGNVGPDLSMIGKKGSRENLFESIIYPDKAIADQYVQWIVETKQGVVLQGLLVEETSDHLIIRDALAKDTKIPIKDVEERKKSPKSIMPSDLLAYMTEDDLVDMVEYLATLTTPTLTVDDWHIIGPFDNIGGDAGLEKALPPEEKIDLAAKYQGKHGPVSWRTVKPNAECYVDLAAFFGAQSNEIVSYLYRQIESPVDQNATILIGTDDGCRLRVNGEVVLSHNRHEAATPERDAVKVKLKQGNNAILLKINNGNNPHGFYFAVQSGEELKLAPIK
jgi:putative heme-binding domain-containing protein